jgi:uncharacterized membrane protein YccF (DUF307 family)
MIRQLLIESIISLMVLVIGQWRIKSIRHSLPYLSASICPFVIFIGLPETRRYFRVGKATQKTTIPTIVLNNELDEETHF